MINLFLKVVVILGFYSLSMLPFDIQAETLRSNTNRDFLGYVDRVESLTYIASDDSLWQANDFLKTAGSVDRFTLELGQTIPNRDLFFGSISGIDSRNYSEVETIASNGSNVLYLVNTVNNYALCGSDIEDFATIYKLERASANLNFAVTDWHLLPSGSSCNGNQPLSSYSAMVVIEGEIFFGGEYSVYQYDYTNKSFLAPLEPSLITDINLFHIRDMAYSDGNLWVLTYNPSSTTESFLTKYDWKSRTRLKTYNINNLVAPRGLAVHGAEIFIGENFNSNPNIHVFEEPL